MATFKNKSPRERVMTMRRVLRRLEKEQSNEDTPAVEVPEILGLMRYIVDHLTRFEEEFEPMEDDDE